MAGRATFFMKLGIGGMMTALIATLPKGVSSGHGCSRRVYAGEKMIGNAMGRVHQRNFGAGHSSKHRPVGGGGQRVQIHRALSKLGEGSRGQNWQKVKDGRVTVNGTIARDPLTWINLASDRLCVDGRLCTATETTRVWMMHKPKGLLTSRSDDRGRATVYSLLPEGEEGDRGGEWRFPVGRLDASSEGLLLFTNSGPLADKLTDPGSCVWKEYLAWVAGGVPTQRTLDLLSSGVELDGKMTREAEFSLASEEDVRERLPLTADVDGASPREDGEKRGKRQYACVRVRLREGRHRQVRRMLQGQGHEVKRLTRVSFGGLTLGRLDQRGVVELSREVVAELMGMPEGAEGAGP